MMQAIFPLLPYLFVTAGLVATLGLFAGLSRRIARLKRSVTECEAGLQAEAAQIANAINDLKRRLSALEQSEGRNGSEAEPATALNNAARAKVFKLHRSGQAADQIAQKLLLPKGEVDLLLKVQRIVMRPYEQTAGGVASEKGVTAQKG